MSRHQNTIAEPVEITGKALFSGDEVQVRLRSAEPGAGVLFVRTDLPDSPVVPATVENLGDGYRSTELRAAGEPGREAATIRSPEHLLSACMGLRVDNLVVEVSGEEMPACGGCALPWAEALRESGIVEQSEEKPSFSIADPIAVSEQEATMTGTPAEEDEESGERGLEISYVLQFHNASRPPEVFACKITPENFMNELASARTFAEEEAYGQFEKRNLGGGVTDDNALVVFDDGSVRTPLSREKVEPRLPNEFARHKVVDVLGDLALAGLDIDGRIVAVRSGHGLNATFASRLRRAAEEGEGPEEYFDIRDIQEILPHRYPFLMVDRVLSIEEENKITGLKNVSVNEQYFQGHYPDYPVMPGVLQLEALAQVAGVLLLQKLEHTGKVAFMVSMEGVKLRKPVQPGDQLVLEAEAARVRSRSAQINARGLVRGEVACEAEMRFMLVDREVL
ncbi:MAG: 3-hydroxyacyl-ACP dehydratase FabZ [Planctomycetota bacterium]